MDKIIGEDLQGVFNFTQITLQKLQDLFLYIGENKPSDISIVSLSRKIGVNDDILANVLYVLNKV